MPITVKDNKEGTPAFTFDFTEGINCKFEGKVKDTDDFTYLVGVFSFSNTIRKVKTGPDGKFDGYEDDYSLDGKIAIGRVRKKEATMYGKTYTPTEWDNRLVSELESFNSQLINLRLRLGELYKIDYEEDKQEGKPGWEERYLKAESTESLSFNAETVESIANSIKSFTSGAGGRKYPTETERLNDRLQFLIDNEESIMQTVTNYAVSIHYSEQLKALRGGAVAPNERINMTDEMLIKLFGAIVNAL